LNVKLNTVRGSPEAGLTANGAGELEPVAEPELRSPLASANPETAAIPATTSTASALSHIAIRVYLRRTA
jgi:hypothetical protein